MRFGARVVLNRVSLEVRRGEIYGLLGANGSGKTTLLRILANAIQGTSGTVNVEGRPGYVSQKTGLYEDLLVEENITFFAQAYGLSGPELKRAVEEIMARLSLADKRDQKTGELSHGWKQRLKLAVALCHQPAILLLDEATAGIDPAARREIWAILSDSARSGTAVLLATHHMDEAEKCDRVGYLQAGSLVVSQEPQRILQEGMRRSGRAVTLSEAIGEMVGNEL